MHARSYQSFAAKSWLVLPDNAIEYMLLTSHLRDEDVRLRKCPEDAVTRVAAKP